MDKLIEEDLAEQEQLSEIVNILQYIVEYPKEGDPVKRSDAFRVIQAHTERALSKLNNTLKIVV
jgi:hypothetical protein